jgi:WXG100 family type VII secretion target
MNDDAFEVDADELLRVVERMSVCETTLHELADQLERQVDRLHLTWQGDAAEAHVLAQRVWDRGFHEMHDALGRMRRAADNAHGNYTSAADTNLRMWEQVG